MRRAGWFVAVLTWTLCAVVGCGGGSNASDGGGVPFDFGPPGPSGTLDESFGTGG